MVMIKWDGRYCVPEGYDFWYSVGPNGELDHWGLWTTGTEPVIYV